MCANPEFDPQQIKITGANESGRSREQRCHDPIRLNVEIGYASPTIQDIQHDAHLRRAITQHLQRVVEKLISTIILVSPFDTAGPELNACILVKETATCEWIGSFDSYATANS
jgi:hypothetical protein